MKHGRYIAGTALGTGQETWKDKKTGEQKVKTVFGIRVTELDNKGFAQDKNHYFNIDSQISAEALNALRQITDREIMLPIIEREIKTSNGSFTVREVDSTRPVLTPAQLKTAAAA